MSKFIGNVSAYAYAVEKGYTGTEEEFALLMASYATVGQTAVEAAQTATTKASEASQSATTASNKASEATTAAQTATDKAESAQTSARNAEGSARYASDKADDAEYYADLAAQHAERAGYVIFDVDEQTGEAIATVTNVVDEAMTFAVDEANGDLEVTLI